MPTNRLSQLIARIDQLNSEDPNTELVQGQQVPRELRYAQRLTEWVLQLRPDASEALRIASRGQHIRRWTIPRDQYPRTRQGYLRWRETLKTFHAHTVAELMREVGYNEELITRVRELILKKRLPADPETQTLEDALCLLFLETQLADLRQKTPPEKMREILQKTWKKMSEQGRTAALKLPLTPEERACITQALLA